MDISIILPAYNEAENLANILPKINHVLSSTNLLYEILVIDTIEPLDDTEKICGTNHACYIPRTGGNLYGDAIRTGFAKADGTYIVVMDADGSHAPDDILRFYTEMQREKYTLVIGSRYCRGGQTENNFILKSMSYILNIVYRIMFGLNIKDVSDSFRMYDSKHIKKLVLECDNFDIVEEILIKLKYSTPGFSAKEIPISFNKRAAGKSKRNLLVFIRSYIKTMKKLLLIKHKTKNDRS